MLKTAFGVHHTLEPFYTGGSAKISLDERMLAATVGEDVHVVDLASGQRMGILRGDSEDVTSVSIRPDGQHVLVCSRSLMIRMFSLLDFTLVKAWKSMHEAPVLVSDIDPTSTLLATGSADSVVKVWDMDGGYCTHHLRGHSGLVSCIKFDTRRNDHRMWLVSGGEDGSVRVWDLKQSSQKAQCKFVFREHTSVVRSVDFGADGWKLVSAARDQIVNVWDLRKGVLLRTIPTFESMEAIGVISSKHFLTLGVSRTDDIIFTAGEKGFLRLWNTETGDQIMEQTARKDAISALYESDRIIAVTSDQNFLYYSLPSLRQGRQLAGYHDEVLDMVFLSSSNVATPSSPEEAIPTYVAMATNSEQPRLVRLADNACDLLYGHEEIVLCLGTNGQGNMLITGSKDQTARIWRVRLNASDDDKKISCVAVCIGHTEAVGAVALSAASQPRCFALTGSQDRTVKYWDLASIDESSDVEYRVKSKYTIQAHEKDINCIDIAPNDRIFATASQDRTIKIWASEEGRLLGTCKGHKRGVWCAKFSPVDQVIASCSGDKTVKIWSLSDFSCLKTFEGHANSVLRVDFLSLGMQLISAGADGQAKLWTIKTEECVATLDNHTEKIWALAVDPSEQLVVTGGADSVVTIWQDRTQEQAEESRQANEQRLRAEQDLANHLAAQDYAGAVRLAIQLKQPFRLLDIFKRLFSHADAGEDSQTGSSMHVGVLSGSNVVDALVKDMDVDTEIRTLLQYIRDWNTDGRHALTAQRLLRTIYGVHPLERIEAIADSKALLDGIAPYTQRHFERVDEQLTRLYLLDYTLKAMNTLIPQTR